MHITLPAPRLCFQLALLAATCIHPLSAQDQGQQNTQPEPVYTTTHLDAVVVSSLDGKPVPRVLVTSPDRHLAAITDSEGRFSFDLRRIASQASTQVFSSYPFTPAAAAATIPVQFIVRKPGFLTDVVIVRVAAAQPSTPEPVLQLKIVPTATLTGHISPESGDLPDNATVQLRQKHVTNGLAEWGTTDVALVDSHGNFRFANLQPGDYKIIVPASVPQNQSLADSIPGFRATFYSNTNNLDSATVLHLGSGESSSVSLTYRNATFYKVTIPVTGLPNGQGFNAALLPDTPGLWFSHSGDIAQGYLPTGTYNLQLTSQEERSPRGEFPTSSIASIHLQVGGKPIRTDPVAFHPAFEIPIEVRVEFTNKPAPQADPQRPYPFTMVSAEPIGTVGLQPMSLNRQDSSVIKNLSEGIFSININSTIGGYVAEATSGSTDLLREPLQILANAAPRPIEVTIRDDAASVTARLAPAANLLPQATAGQPVSILCIPLDHPQAHAINFSVQGDEFSMPNLAPGRYLILASHQNLSQNTPQALAIEYRNDEVVRGLLPKGVTITLSPNQKADIEIPLMPEDAH